MSQNQLQIASVGIPGRAGVPGTGISTGPSYQSFNLEGSIREDGPISYEESARELLGVALNQSDVGGTITGHQITATVAPVGTVHATCVSVTLGEYPDNFSEKRWMILRLGAVLPGSIQTVPLIRISNDNGSSFGFSVDVTTGAVNGDSATAWGSDILAYFDSTVDGGAVHLATEGGTDNQLPLMGTKRKALQVLFAQVFADSDDTREISLSYHASYANAPAWAQAIINANGMLPMQRTKLPDLYNDGMAEFVVRSPSASGYIFNTNAVSNDVFLVRKAFPLAFAKSSVAFEEIASEALGIAVAAQGTANNSAALAQSAESAASTAATVAANAQTTAANAQTTAANAQTTANEALTEASGAVVTLFASAPPGGASVANMDISGLTAPVNEFLRSAKEFFYIPWTRILGLPDGNGDVVVYAVMYAAGDVAVIENSTVAGASNKVGYTRTNRDFLYYQALDIDNMVYRLRGFAGSVFSQDTFEYNVKGYPLNGGTPLNGVLRAVCGSSNYLVQAGDITTQEFTDRATGTKYTRTKTGTAAWTAWV